MSEATNDEVRREFAAVGVEVDDGVISYSSPSAALFRPFSNWGLFVTRHRVITRIGSELTLWVAYTGPTPGKQLGKFQLVDLAQVSEGRRWDVITLRGVKLWTRVGQRPTIAAWRALASS